MRGGSESIVAALAFLALCPPAAPAQDADAPLPVRFEEVAASAGLDFVLDNHPTPKKRMIETMAGGVAVFDYDGDSRPDIFFTNGAEIPTLEKTSEKYSNRLYRNLGDWSFRDVTAEAKLAGAGYSMGASAADFDNDGHVDLFVAGTFRNLLYRNNGDGTFDDITARSGVDSEHWSVAAGWFDYDGDGLLDLFVVNYAEWSMELDRFCGDRAKGVRVYCHPKYFAPTPNQLYRNLGDGRFEDVSKSSGIAAHAGRGMSVAFADYDGDSRIDIFVTNDNLPNFLFRNRGDGGFDEEALFAGVALLDHGKPVASMGADFRDYDNDGLPDIAVTALSGETFPIFRNTGDGFFEDRTFASGVAKASARLAGWSLGLVDLNNDGAKDLFAANAHVNDLVEQFENYVYEQPNTVFLNVGDGKFRDASAEAGEAFQRKAAHRGSGFADFDGDGRIDVVVSVLGGPAELWRNVTGASGASGSSAHWIAFRLIGAASNRDGFGARIRVGDQWNEATGSLGYASSSHGPVHFGLGSVSQVDEAEIVWPSGRRQILRDLAADQVVEVNEPRPAP